MWGLKTICTLFFFLFKGLHDGTDVLLFCRVAAAMSHASDLWDQKSQQGRAQGSKDDAVHKAGEITMSLCSKKVRLLFPLTFHTTFLTLCMSRITMHRPGRDTQVTSQVVMTKEATGTVANRYTVGQLRSLSLESGMHQVEGTQVGFPITNRKAGTAVMLKSAKVAKLTAIKGRTETTRQATVMRLRAITIRALVMGAMVSHKATAVVTANKVDTEGTKCVFLRSFINPKYHRTPSLSSKHLHASGTFDFAPPVALPQ